MQVQVHCPAEWQFKDNCGCPVYSQPGFNSLLSAADLLLTIRLAALRPTEEKWKRMASLSEMGIV